MTEFGRSTHEAHSFAELKSAVEKGLSKLGLMLFMQLDHGAILREETGHETPKMIRFVMELGCLVLPMVGVGSNRQEDTPSNRSRYGRATS
jgi:hypothetical protein